MFLALKHIQCLCCCLGLPLEVFSRALSLGIPPSGAWDILWCWESSKPRLPNAQSPWSNFAYGVLSPTQHQLLNKIHNASKVMNTWYAFIPLQHAKGLLSRITPGRLGVRGMEPR